MMKPELEVFFQGSPFAMTMLGAGIVVLCILVWVCVFQYRLDKAEKQRREDWDRHCQGLERWRQHHQKAMDYALASNRRIREQLIALERHLGLEPLPLDPQDVEEAAAFARFRAIEQRLGIAPEASPSKPQQDG